MNSHTASDLRIAWHAMRDSHLHRYIGMTGIRRVQIDVFTGSVPILSYVIDHFWRTVEDEIQSIFHLQKPPGISGTSVLMREYARPQKTQVWIKLSTARSTIEVDARRLSQRVLGTDFSYEDLQFWFPFTAYSGLVVKKYSFNDLAKSFDLTGVQEGRECSVLLQFEPRSASLIRCNQSGPSGVEKCWIVDEFKWFGSIFSPTRLRIERDKGAFRSTMNLLGIAFDIPLDPAMFSASHLGALHAGRYEAALNQLVPHG
jgi:hypothetical protein